MKGILKLSLLFSTVVLVGITTYAAKNQYDIASGISDSEVKCVAEFIKSGVPRKHIEILNGTGTCKNLLTGVIK